MLVQGPEAVRCAGYYHAIACPQGPHRQFLETPYETPVRTTRLQFGYHCGFSDYRVGNRFPAAIAEVFCRLCVI